MSRWPSCRLPVGAARTRRAPCRRVIPAKAGRHARPAARRPREARRLRLRPLRAVEHVRRRRTAPLLEHAHVPAVARVAPPHARVPPAPAVLDHPREAALAAREDPRGELARGALLSLIHISEPTRLGMISYAVFCLKK